MMLMIREKKTLINICLLLYHNSHYIESFTIPKQQVSYMIPQQFEEVIVRVFTRDPEKVTAIQKAFRRLLKGILPSESNAQPNAALTIPNDYDQTVRLKRQRSGSLQGGMDGKEVVKKWSGNCK